MPRQPPSMILFHATVRTMDPHQPHAEAVALRHGRIAAVGSDAEVLPLRGHGTTIVSCQGAALLPGFIDAHLHLRSYVSTLLGIDCRPPAVRSIHDLQTVLHDAARRRPPGCWLVGHGYDDFALAERRHPTRWDLDAVTPQHPVRLAHRSRHAWVCNSLALAQLGITDAFVPPPGGMVQRDPVSGQPTGLLIDMDGYLRSHLPPSIDPEAFRQGVERPGGVQGIPCLDRRRRPSGADWPLAGGQCAGRGGGGGRQHRRGRISMSCAGLQDSPR